MPIKSNATPDELSSLFYQANKKLCEGWETFIQEKNGQTNAVFNSWSLNLKAKVSAKNTWLITVKKASYSNGHLLFSSKRQNLQEILEFQTKIKRDCPNFRINKSWWNSKSVRHNTYQCVYQFLNTEPRGKDPITAEYNDGLLTLIFHHRNDDFELVERVLNLDIE